MAIKEKGTAVARAKIQLPVDVNAAMAAELLEIQKRISAPSGNRITVTQSKEFKFPNGLTSTDPFEAIVIDFAAANYYYADAYDRNNVTPPVCHALGLEPAGLTPSDTVVEPQAGSCASCWANAFGSNGKGKACQNSRLLAVIPLDADIETPIWIIKVSPTAIRAFDAHVAQVARAYQLPVRGVVTELSFSPDNDYATLRFRAIGPAPKDLVMMAQSRKVEAQTLLLTEPAVQAVGATQKVKAPAKKAAGRGH
jgi:hypothetical protein